MKGELCKLAMANSVIPLVGTGTLANDAMLGQLKSEFPHEAGLVLVNGEFGDRLYNQAKQWGLHIEKVDVGWGNPFDIAQIEAYLKKTVIVTLYLSMAKRQTVH